LRWAGRGGASIYGKQFDDEITDELKHTGQCDFVNSTFCDFCVGDMTWYCLQCFDTAGWAAGRASGL